MVPLFTFLLDESNLEKMNRSFELAEKDREARFADVNLDDNWTPDKVFDLSDQDESGYLDMEELEFALTSVLGKLVTRAEVEKLMVKYDTDNSGTLDKEEFRKVSRAVSRPQKMSIHHLNPPPITVRQGNGGQEKKGIQKSGQEEVNQAARGENWREVKETVILKTNASHAAGQLGDRPAQNAQNEGGQENGEPAELWYGLF